MPRSSGHNYVGDKTTTSFSPAAFSSLLQAQCLPVFLAVEKTRLSSRPDLCSDRMDGVVELNLRKDLSLSLNSSNVLSWTYEVRVWTS